MQTTTGKVFTHEDFWAAFVNDLEQARRRVLIQSPFASLRRIRALAKVLAGLTNNRVAVCVFVQEPRHWRQKPELREPEIVCQISEAASAFNTLASLGLHVTLRAKIHAKLAVIDDKILWEGSLNILSHLNTEERMRRWADPAQTREAVAQHHLDKCSVCAAVRCKYAITSRSSLASSIADRRAQLQLSQSELAQHLRITQSQISRIESGESNITADSLLSIVGKLELKLFLLPESLAPSVTSLLSKLQD